MVNILKEMLKHLFFLLTEAQNFKDASATSE